MKERKRTCGFDTPEQTNDHSPKKSHAMPTYQTFLVPIFNF